MRAEIVLARSPQTSLNRTHLGGKGGIYTSAVIADLATLDWHSFLGRPALPSPPPQALHSLRQHRVLIAGAAGSIGTALSRRIAELSPRELVLLDTSAEGLAALQNKLADCSATRFTLGDAGDRNLIYDVFAKYAPTLVFHAAAYKHVPRLEEQPFAAVRNNVFVTEALVSIATSFGARVVLLSTDKAVEPASIMGATKRAAEQIVRSTGGTVVRLGNVLGSSGSVVETFALQLAKGDSLTVTSSGARRYFVTLAEAVNLLIAGTIPRNPGGIFVPALTSQYFISDLAAFLARELTPDREPRIAFTQPRPGDKECEQLWSPSERPGKPDSAGLIPITSPQCEPVFLQTRLAQLRAALDHRDLSTLLTTLRCIVPDYSPSATILDLTLRCAAPAAS
jgi:FlaA1/EpsC-like NDP-sugar epimerase